MDLTGFVVDVVVLVVILAIVISVVRAWRNRPARANLVALPPESRVRYVAAWERIEKRFMDAPEEATSEADSLLLAMLGERGHPMVENRLPNQFRSARGKREAGRRRHRTEDLRQALLGYRAVFHKMIGPETQSEEVAEGRRETA
jgi:hypothetical protein